MLFLFTHNKNNPKLKDAPLQKGKGGGGGGGSPKTLKKIHARHKLKKKYSCIAKEPENNILQGQPMRLCIHITQFVNNMPVVGGFLPSFPQQPFQ